MGDQGGKEAAIIKAIEETGYPTEIVVATQMQRQGWEVRHNPSFLDDVEHKHREYDINAFRHWTDGSEARKIIVSAQLFVECKKSVDGGSWVFFMTPEKHEEEYVVRRLKFISDPRSLMVSDYEARLPAIPASGLITQHHYFARHEWARAFYEPHKKEQQKLYGAVLAAVKALIFTFREESKFSFRDALRLYYPVIVFDGDIYEAHVDEKKNISVNPSEHLQVAFNYSAPGLNEIFNEPHERDFIVDVVTEGYFPTFLRRLEDDHTWIATRVGREARAGNRDAPEPYGLF